MTRPKRHHWWPLVQSQRWLGPDGLIHVTRADGSTFRTNPLNIGVESELYTKTFADGAKCVELEEWLANEIDDPFRAAVDALHDRKRYRRRRFVGDPTKAQVCRQLGFVVDGFVDSVVIDSDTRWALARYVAAQIVRSPPYLRKLTEFHAELGSGAKNAALDNMRWLFDVYSDRIANADLALVCCAGSHQFIFADGGVVVDEPWRRHHGIPFDAHAPLTPTLALQVMPTPDRHFGNDLPISYLTNNGTARFNRIILGHARNFVFSQKAPPIEFIKTNFGVPAPRNIGYRYVDGRLETVFDPDRK